MTQKLGRNDPCPCGSGKKYKHCCGAPQAAQQGRREISYQFLWDALGLSR